jgi:hypothetical protein
MTNAVQYGSLGGGGGGQFRSSYGIGVIVCKVCVFCDQLCVLCGKCVSNIVKTKCVNSNNIGDIYDKLNFITNYTHFIKNIHTLQFPSQDLRIS